MGRFSCCCRIRSRFSLIELLVVIVIISILAAMLMPTLSQARARARASTCAANLKTIGTANLLYSNDFDGFDVRLKDDNWGCMWISHSIFYQYLGTETGCSDYYLPSETSYRVVPFSRICPEMTGAFTNPETGRVSIAAYGKNLDGLGHYLGSTTGQGAWAYIYQYSKVREPSARIHHVENFNQSVTPYTSDWVTYRKYAVYPFLYQTGKGIFFIHSMRANVLFFDGHVAAMGQPELYREEHWYAYEN